MPTREQNGRSISKLEVRRSDETPEFWLSKPYLDEELRSAIRGAAVVVLPVREGEDVGGPVFVAGATELYRELQAALPEHRIEIAIRDEDYRELLLHSFLVDLGLILLQESTLGMIPNVLWDYVKLRIGILKDTTTKVRLLVAPRDRDSPTIELSFEGRSEDFRTAIAPVLSDILNRSGKIPSASPTLLDDGDHKDSK